MTLKMEMWLQKTDHSSSWWHQVVETCRNSWSFPTDCRADPSYNLDFKKWTLIDFLQHVSSSLLTFIFELAIMGRICVIEDLEVNEFVDTERIKTICFLSVSLEGAAASGSLLLILLHKFSCAQNILNNFYLRQFTKEVFMFMIKIIMVMSWVFVIENILERSKQFCWCFYIKSYL